MSSFLPTSYCRADLKPTFSITMREIAQSAIAFHGHPVLAKFALAAAFDPQNEEGSSLYNRIFNTNLSAEQLLLPTLVTRQIKGRITEYLRQGADESIPGGPSDVDWLTYARMHIAGLVGEWLRIDDSRSETTTDGFLSATDSRACVATIGQFFDLCRLR